MSPTPTTPATLADILQSHRTRRPIVMGILNVTPDSFSDGGKFLDPSAAVEHALRMRGEGADIVDVGAESTRPGSTGLPAAEQIARLRPVLQKLAGAGVLISIDTTSAEVARFALDHGAAILNDISAGRDDGAMLPLAASAGAPIILMHMLGSPRTMQQNPTYGDVVAQVRGFLEQRVAAAVATGVPRDHCIVDPGIGFGKTLEHNLALLAGTVELASLQLPVLVGPSRKRFIGTLTGQSVAEDRVAGTIAACVDAYARGATIFRVHDVAQTVAALAVARAIDQARGNHLADDDR